MASRLTLKKPVRQEQVVMYELKTNGLGVMGPHGVKSPVALVNLLSADLVRNLPVASRTRPTVWKML